MNNKPKVSSSEDAYSIFLEYFDDDSLNLKEYMWAMFLSRSNRCLAVCIMSNGSTTGTVMDIGHLVYTCLKLNSSGVILAHNHPSESLEPSRQDKDLTYKAKIALDYLDKNLFDHLIVSRANYFSFADNGLI